MAAPTDSKLVQDSWALLKSKVTLQQAGDLFYSTLFDTAPHLKNTLFKDTDHKKQSFKLMEMIDGAIGLLEKDPITLVHALYSLGERHAGYGVEDAHYPVVGSVLIKVLRLALTDAFTPAVEKAWGNTFNVIATSMQVGANTEAGKAKAAAYRLKHGGVKPGADSTSCCSPNCLLVGAGVVVIVAAIFFRMQKK